MTDTLDKLQDVGEGFHALADDVLRYLYPRCRALEPFGRNSEGKPIVGTPDSYVGSSPSDCTIAVEYTTYAIPRLSAKLLSDYKSASEKCKAATEIILCTNRPRTEGVADAVEAAAAAAGKTLTIVWGEEIAGALDARQDLRLEHLRIPHRTLTRDSIVGVLLTHVRRALEVQLGATELEALNGRLFRRPMEPQFLRLHRRPGLTLVVADAGQGKTCWSAATALRFARVRPVVWFPAKQVGPEDLNAAIVRASYGVADPTKVHELVTLLQSTQQTLLVFVDAIDECGDYAAMLERVRAFTAQSALAPRTHLVLTCRVEAVEAFDQLDPTILPQPSHHDLGRRLVLDPLRVAESEQLLRRNGTSPNEAHELRHALPSEFFANPLYLRLARELQREGELPARGARWIDTFATRYVDDIRRRLATTAGTARPSRRVVEQALAELAYLALIDPQGADPRIATHALIQPSLDGEGTFLERAVQSGLLQRSGDRVRFCHALFAEYFGAWYLIDAKRTPAEVVEALAGLPGRRSLALFATERDPSLLVPLAQTHAALVPTFEVTRLPPETQDVLVARAGDLLRSVYPSDRRAAVRILGELRTSAAVKTAVEWFNGLEQRAKHERLDEATDLFLRLQLPGAVRIVAHHRELWRGGSFPWYEPEFAQRLENLDPNFRRLLADDALAVLKEAVQGQDAGPTALLGYLRDPRLLEWLRTKAATGALTMREHRALFHFNSDEAMEILLASRSHVLAALDAMKGEEDEAGIRRSMLWDSLFPNAADVLRFPHDALVRLAQRELESDDRRRRHFGSRLADHLRASELIDGYAEYVAERKKAGFIVFHDRMIQALVAEMDPGEVVELYNAAKSAPARKAILQAAGEVHSDAVEDLLLTALDDELLFGAACIGLMQLRSQRAGPKLHAKLASRTGNYRYLTVKALGRIQYTPALADLIEALHANSADEDADELITAIGLIGGASAYEALVSSYNDAPRLAVLTVLLDAPDPGARQAVHTLLETHPHIKAVLGQAFAHTEYLHDDRFYPGDDTVRPELRDDTILRALLDTARARLAAPPARDTELSNDCRAIARFDHPDAAKFFEDLAELVPASESEAESVRGEIHFAQRLLAHRGNDRWLRAMLERDIDAIATRRWVDARQFDELTAYPPTLVREALAKRLANDPQRWLLGYVRFAPKDDPLLLENLARVDHNLADVIRQKLPGVS
jgi:hypothetical protein